MSLEKVPKDHPLRREEKWEHFLGERVVAGFRCEVKLTMSNRFSFFSLFTSRFVLDVQNCLSVWESRRGWICFWIWRNPPNTNRERLCEVVVHVLGQKCKRCSNGSLKPKRRVAILANNTKVINTVQSIFYIKSNRQSAIQERIFCYNDTGKRN